MANQDANWKNEFLHRIQCDKIRTDSDIEDFCAELGLSEKVVYQYLAELQTEHTECEGCQHIAFFQSGMYPCNMCRRGKEDLFVRAE